MPYRTFFPVFASDVYGVGSVGLGVMGVAMSIGALVGSLFVASLSSGSRRSMIQLTVGLGFGVTLVLFGAAPTLELGLLVLIFLGFASNAFWALNNTMVLGNTSERYYGRVMSVYMLSWSVMPFVAMPESALADQVGVQVTVAGVGALLVVMLLAIVLFLPGYRRMQEREGTLVGTAGRR
jgi:MFS family permease